MQTLVSCPHLTFSRKFTSSKMSIDEFLQVWFFLLFSFYPTTNTKKETLGNYCTEQTLELLSLGHTYKDSRIVFTDTPLQDGRTIFEIARTTSEGSPSSSSASPISHNNAVGDSTNEDDDLSCQKASISNTSSVDRTLTRYDEKTIYMDGLNSLVRRQKNILR